MKRDAEIEKENIEMESQNEQDKKDIERLQEFLDTRKNLKEWKRGEAVRLRLLGSSYQEIQTRLQVSISFIARNQKKFFHQGIEGLKLAYKGSESYLTEAQKQEVMEWLEPRERRNISELERHLIETYDVVFRSRESYYQILREKQLSWQKGNKENPRKKPEEIKKRNQEIDEMLRILNPLIESGELVVYVLDECHLQGDEICGYLWGDRKKREIVQVSNERDRQTYYGGLNLVDKSFVVAPYSGGNGVNTVKFIEKLKQLHPGKKILLIWDGASYHRGEEMKKLLAQENEGKAPEDWLITCCLLPAYAPEENPVEAIWLQVKNFIRRFYYLCRTFSIVKRLFKLFFDYKLFNIPNLEKYDAFVQFI
jgi:transposase